MCFILTTPNLYKAYGSRERVGPPLVGCPERGSLNMYLTRETKSQGGQARAKGANAPPRPLEKNSGISYSTTASALPDIYT